MANVTIAQPKQNFQDPFKRITDKPGALGVYLS